MEFKDYLRIMEMKDASDLYLSAGALPSIKIHGQLRPLEKEPCAPGRVKEIAYATMDEAQRTEFERKPEMNLAISESGVGRFRVNIFKQRNEVSMVVRSIKAEIPETASLGLPEVLTKVIMNKRGLVLIVGGAGSGKSTSLASLINYRNTHSAGHIVTIEDLIEFAHPHKKSIVNQREVGMDTDCYEDALENALRQAPDVIVIGEIRDRRTMERAIAFAETGHLAVSTLHGNNANQALDRIINLFPADHRQQLQVDLALNLRALVSQRLVVTTDSKRTAAVEVLLGTPRVSDLISRGEMSEIGDVMEKSQHLGMQTFNTAVFKLYQAGRITLEEAMRNADSQHELQARIGMLEAESDPKDIEGVASGLELMDEPKPEGPADFSRQEEETG